ncbi:uncharacterized protein [Branchiostoma lanceolatum]|uniref:uncharacterized protein n=1 Tax=Branchiostoma lanceolatum TaxID=7740 RepID=UPI00345201FC
MHRLCLKLKFKDRCSFCQKTGGGGVSVAMGDESVAMGDVEIEQEVKNENRPWQNRLRGNKSAQNRQGQKSTGQNSKGQKSTGQNSTGLKSTGQNSTGQNSTGQISTDQISTGQNNTGQNSTGQNSTGQSSTGQNSTGQNSTGQNITGQSSTGQNSTGQNSTGQISTDQISTGQNSTGQNNIGQSSTGQSSTDQISTDQISTGQSSTDQSSTDQNSTDQISTGQSSTGQNNTGQSNTGQSSTGQNNTGQNSTGQKNTGQNNTGQNSTDQDSTGQNSTGQNSTGQNSTGQNSTGQNSTGQNSTGQNSTGQNSTGQNSTGQNSTGQNSTGQNSTGQTNTGQNSTGQNSTGQSSTGQNSTVPNWAKLGSLTQEHFCRKMLKLVEIKYSPAKREKAKILVYKFGEELISGGTQSAEKSDKVFEQMVERLKIPHFMVWKLRVLRRVVMTCLPVTSGYQSHLQQARQFCIHILQGEFRRGKIAGIIEAIFLTLSRDVDVARSEMAPASVPTSQEPRPALPGPSSQGTVQEPAGLQEKGWSGNLVLEPFSERLLAAVKENYTQWKVEKVEEVMNWFAEELKGNKEFFWRHQHNNDTMIDQTAARLNLPRVAVWKLKLLRRVYIRCLPKTNSELIERARKFCLQVLRDEFYKRNISELMTVAFDRVPTNATPATQKTAAPEPERESDQTRQEPRPALPGPSSQGTVQEPAGFQNEGWSGNLVLEPFSQRLLAAVKVNYTERKGEKVEEVINWFAEELKGNEEFVWRHQQNNDTMIDQTAARLYLPPGSAWKLKLLRRVYKRCLPKHHPGQIERARKFCLQVLRDQFYKRNISELMRVAFDPVPTNATPATQKTAAPEPERESDQTRQEPQPALPGPSSQGTAQEPAGLQDEGWSGNLVLEPFSQRLLAVVKENYTERKVGKVKEVMNWFAEELKGNKELFWRHQQNNDTMIDQLAGRLKLPPGSVWKLKLLRRVYKRCLPKNHFELIERARQCCLQVLRDEFYNFRRNISELMAVAFDRVPTNATPATQKTAAAELERESDQTSQEPQPGLSSEGTPQASAAVQKEATGGTLITDPFSQRLLEAAESIFPRPSIARLVERRIYGFEEELAKNTEISWTSKHNNDAAMEQFAWRHQLPPASVWKLRLLRRVVADCLPKRDSAQIKVAQLVRGLCKVEFQARFFTVTRFVLGNMLTSSRATDRARKWQQKMEERDLAREQAMQGGAQPRQQAMQGGAQPWQQPMQGGAQPWQQPMPGGAQPWQQPMQGGAQPWQQPMPGRAQPWQQPMPGRAQPWQQPMPGGAQPQQQTIPGSAQPWQQLMPGRAQPWQQIMQGRTQPWQQTMPGGVQPWQQPKPGGLQTGQPPGEDGQDAAAQGEARRLAAEKLLLQEEWERLAAERKALDDKLAQHSKHLPQETGHHGDHTEQQVSANQDVDYRRVQVTSESSSYRRDKSQERSHGDPRHDNRSPLRHDHKRFHGDLHHDDTSPCRYEHEHFHGDSRRDDSRPTSPAYMAQRDWLPEEDAREQRDEEERSWPGAEDRRGRGRSWERGEEDEFLPGRYRRETSADRLRKLDRHEDAAGSYTRDWPYSAPRAPAYDNSTFPAEPPPDSRDAQYNRSDRREEQTLQQTGQDDVFRNLPRDQSPPYALDKLSPLPHKEYTSPPARTGIHGNHDQPGAPPYSAGDQPFPAPRSPGNSMPTIPAEPPQTSYNDIFRSFLQDRSARDKFSQPVAPLPHEEYMMSPPAGPGIHGDRIHGDDHHRSNSRTPSPFLLPEQREDHYQLGRSVGRTSDITGGATSRGAAQGGATIRGAGQGDATIRGAGQGGATAEGLQRGVL